MTSTGIFRPTPRTFRKFGGVESIEALRARYGVGERTIKRWRTECGIVAPSDIRTAIESRIVPLPADFATVAPTMLIVELVKHYGRDRKTIHRWLTETGTSPRPYRRTSEQAHAPKPVLPRRKPGRPPSMPRQTAPLAGREEEAAQFLRRWTFVFRCGEKGAADTGGGFWRYGNAVLTGAELVARAERHGFDPDQWRVIAGQSIRRDAIPSFPRAGAM